MKYLFKKHCLVWDYDNRRMQWYKKGFYWLKTFICLVLKMERKQTYMEIAMLAFDHTKGSWEYGGRDWTEIAIGEGFFSNWYYSIYGNGTH